jgi:monoamine oxidase
LQINDDWQMVNNDEKYIIKNEFQMEDSTGQKPDSLRLKFRQDRRHFLKKTILAGTGAILTLKDSLSGPRVTKKVVVAGAGIGGLCCGYELMKLDHEVIVLEASSSHGGHIRTGREGLSDGLYADLGAEHITKPGYEKYWEYIEELNLAVLPYPRRKNILRRIDGEFYTEEMLSDPAVLKKFGFNGREIKYLIDNPWWDLKSLFTGPYLDKFTDEYQPFGIGYDSLDQMPMADIYSKEGASDAARRRLGGEYVSALYELWQAAILRLRGVPLWPPDVYRLKGGNRTLPDTFASILGDRVKLNCTVSEIRHGQSGVTVSYTDQSDQKEISADYLIVCIPPPAFRKLKVDPPLSPEKQFALDHVAYDSYSRFVFQASSSFWEEDDLSINMELNHPDIGSIWQTAHEVKTEKALLLGSGPGGIPPQQALSSFRSIYPGKQVPVDYAMSQDWTKDHTSPTCERLPFPMATLNKFWPHIMTRHGRIHFAGAYADNLNWGMEAATRSANRVVRKIDQD